MAIHNKEIKRGDILLVDLGKWTGSEQGGERPCLVVSNNVGNKFSNIVQIVPFTSKRKELPTHVYISMDDVLNKNYSIVDSSIICEQIRTIDKSRIIKPIGKLKPHKLIEVNKAIEIALDL